MEAFRFEELSEDLRLVEPGGGLRGSTCQFLIERGVARDGVGLELSGVTGGSGGGEDLLEPVNGGSNGSIS